MHTARLNTTSNAPTDTAGADLQAFVNIIPFCPTIPPAHHLLDQSHWPQQNTSLSTYVYLIHCLFENTHLLVAPAELATVTVSTPSASYIRVNGNTASTLTFLAAAYGNIQINAPASAIVSATPSTATVTYY